MKAKEKMTKMKAMQSAELAKEIEADIAKLRSLISGSVTGKIKNVREIKYLHRDIARLMTIAAEKANQ